MKGIIKFAIWGILFTVIVLCLVYVLVEYKTPKVAYVENQSVFTGYKATKELNKKLIKIKEKQTAVLDSVLLLIRVAEAKGPKSPELRAKQELYNSLYEDFSEDYAQLVEENSKGVWNQLNAYIFEYGKANNYKIILGANGQGNIMYADTSLNITKEVLEYANKKYEDK